MKQKKIQIYTATMAKLLMDWRISQGLSRYEVAKSTGMNINTVKRLEEGKGGISFEDGLRYLLHAESHKSKPNLMKVFRQAMAAYQSEQDMQAVVFAQQKQRRGEAIRKDFERRKVELTTRQTVQMEMSEKIAALTTEHNAKTSQLEEELKIAREQNAAMQRQLQETEEKHVKELEDAKKDGTNDSTTITKRNWYKRLISGI